MNEIKTVDQAKEAFAQMVHLAQMSLRSLKQGDLLQAIAKIEGCIRLAHGFRNARVAKREILACAVSDHWRLGCCHAALGSSHHGQALAHLNAVRRFYKWTHGKKRVVSNKMEEAIRCGALATIAKIYSLQGRFRLALLRSEEGLDALYGNEELSDAPAADLIQMVCFCLRGEALHGLGHGADVVVRHFEQVMLHYRRYVSNPVACKDRKQLTRSGGEHMPWFHDCLHPEATRDRALAAMKAIRDSLSGEKRIWADRTINDFRAQGDPLD